MNFKLRLVLLTCGWFLFSVVLLGSLFYYQHTTVEQRTQQSLHRDLATHMRDDSPLMIGHDYNPKALKAIFHTLMLLGPDFEIYFLDQYGQVQSHAAPKGREIASHVDLAPINQFLSNASFPILGDDPRHPDQKTVFSVAPIFDEQQISPIGYLYVVIGSEQHALLAQDAWQALFPFSPILLLLAIALIGGLSLSLYVLVTTSLLRPIQTITQQLQQQAQNDFLLPRTFTAQVPELTPITKQFYAMAQTISRQFLQLQQQEQQRRELLMQLSHDLKTPLSSIMGYLETWTIQNQPADPLILTAQKNAQKLADLLQQQMTLARAATANAKNTVAFDSVKLSDIIDEVLANVKPQADKKALRLSLSLPPEDTLVADTHLLQRLFTNLFDNAIRHAPSHGRITLRVQHLDEGYAVQLFNAVDPKAPTGSLGLGTKIIRSILMLHHSHLTTRQSDAQFEQAFVLPLQP
ncbi:sensor histidine kinase [Photobacterium aphoticum]|uniref:histidine kinase n=1 Tax=Photobacterium aphoticum TaxID=754436 RepID=A0A0J1GSQ8_9GAMM|nr:HAMP domain-containing sensor histidine kinase [Photobacterium aphoticum]KLV02494.1 histidine kinase [Photobacterium aphoticum]PSU56940.1 sensor histidine kinase [Photobacterium aphoticum]GHA64697.1 histidine kinase [Photobacterium aphoticum]